MIDLALFLSYIWRGILKFEICNLKLEILNLKLSTINYQLSTPKLLNHLQRVDKLCNILLGCRPVGADTHGGVVRICAFDDREAELPL